MWGMGLVSEGEVMGWEEFSSVEFHRLEGSDDQWPAWFYAVVGLGVIGAYLARELSPLVVSGQLKFWP